MVKAIMGTKSRNDAGIHRRRNRRSGNGHRGRPCVVVQNKTVENDGYSAVQLGYGEIKEKLVNKPPWLGHFKKAGVQIKRYLREFRRTRPWTSALKIKADVFAEGRWWMLPASPRAAAKGRNCQIGIAHRPHDPRLRDIRTSRLHGRLLLSGARCSKGKKAPRTCRQPEKDHPEPGRW